MKKAVTKTPMMVARDAGVKSVTLRGCTYYFNWECDDVVFVQAYNGKGKQLWDASVRVREDDTIGRVLRFGRTVWSETRY